MSNMSNAEQEALHYYCSITDFAALAELDGLYHVLKTLLDILNMSKAMPKDLVEQRLFYNMLQELQNDTINDMFNYVVLNMKDDNE